MPTKLNLSLFEHLLHIYFSEAVEAGKYVSPSYIKVLQNAFNAVQISASGKRDISSVVSI